MPLADGRLPLPQEVGDGTVERLVGGVHRTHDVVVDLHLRHEAQHGVGGRGIGPRSPLDDETAAHVGEVPAGRGEHVLVAADRRGVVGEHEREAAVTGSGDRLDGLDRVGRPGRRDHAVVGFVPAPERLEQCGARSLVG
jgi:hypothetical protein